jgi:hypothetical protein
MTEDSKFAPLRSEKGPTIYPPLAEFVMNLYGEGRIAGTLVFGIPPDRANRRRAFVKFAPDKSVSVNIEDSKFAPLKSEKGPTIYPPLAAFVMNLYGKGRIAGTLAFGIPPLLVNLRRAFVKFAPDKSVSVNIEDSKFAPLKSEKGPTMYPPLAEFVMNLYGTGSVAGTLAFGIPPLLVNRRRAFVKFAPNKSVSVNIEDSKFAPLKSEKGPIMYPPLTEFVMNLYGEGRIAGTLVFGIPPDLVYLNEVDTDGNIV